MSDRTLTAPHDSLGEVLHFLRMSGSFYCRSELTAPWGLTLPPMPGYMWFHVVTSGACWLGNDAGDSQQLLPGGFALVPHGEGHDLRSEPGAPAPSILDLDREQVSDRYEILRYGGGGAHTTGICGAVRFDHAAASNLLAVLPRQLYVHDEGLLGSWMQSTLRLVAAEAAGRRPGGETVITRLCDVLVIQAIRGWIETDPRARTGWLGALRDPQIGRAIALIQREPERRWTVELLARELAMSRSAFAARFTDLVGEPAMRYVTRWRMSVAVDLLRQGVGGMELVHRLGYGSEAAFSRAFKRSIGVPPGSIRRGRAEDGRWESSARTESVDSRACGAPAEPGGGW